MKKYKVSGYSYGCGKIEEIEVERESESCLWIKGRRANKRADWENYFDSWNEAHEFLLKRAERDVISARRALELANAKFGNIKGMKVPS